MKRILLPLLFLAAAGMAANGCDRDDSAGGPKSEPAGIGKDVAKAPSTGSSETTSKAGGSGVTQSGKDSAASPSPGEQTGSGADTPVSKGSPSAGPSPTSKAGEGLGSGVAQADKDSSAGVSQSGRSGSGVETSPSEGASSAGSTDPSKAGTSPGSGSAQSEKDTSVSGSQSGQAGRGTDTAQSGDPTKAGQDAASASQSQDKGGQADVRQAQQALKNQGQDPGPIDGIMGPQTRQALRGFQKANGLEQTGTLDAETKQKLNIEGTSSGSSGSASMGSGQKEPSSSPTGK